MAQQTATTVHENFHSDLVNLLGNSLQGCRVSHVSSLQLMAASDPLLAYLCRLGSGVAGFN